MNLINAIDKWTVSLSAKTSVNNSGPPRPGLPLPSPPPPSNVLQIPPSQIQNNFNRQDLLKLQESEVEKERIVAPPARPPSTPSNSSPFDVRSPLPANPQTNLRNNNKGLKGVIFDTKTITKPLPPSETSALDQMLQKILEGSSPRSSLLDHELSPPFLSLLRTLPNIFL